jgi:hypothetical protein
MPDRALLFRGVRIPAFETPWMVSFVKVQRFTAPAMPISAFEALSRARG